MSAPTYQRLCSQTAMPGLPIKKRTLSENLAQNGFHIFENFFSEPEIRGLCDEMRRIESLPPENSPRNLLRSSDLVNQIAHTLLAPLRDALGDATAPFSAFFLDKSAERNWQMPWHQNLRLPVE